MKSTSRITGPGLYTGTFPDGLDVPAIDALISETATQTDPADRPTSALLDGSAAERRRRRIERRALAAVVRSLPVRPAATSTYPTDVKEAS